MFIPPCLTIVRQGGHQRRLQAALIMPAACGNADDAGQLQSGALNPGLNNVRE